MRAVLKPVHPNAPVSLFKSCPGRFLPGKRLREKKRKVQVDAQVDARHNEDRESLLLWTSYYRGFTKELETSLVLVVVELATYGNGSSGGRSSKDQHDLTFRPVESTAYYTERAERAACFMSKCAIFSCFSSLILKLFAFCGVEKLASSEKIIPIKEITQVLP